MRRELSIHGLGWHGDWDEMLWHDKRLCYTQRHRLHQLAGQSCALPRHLNAGPLRARYGGGAFADVRLRRFLAVVAGASQAAIPSHALAALTALNRE